MLAVLVAAALLPEVLAAWSSLLRLPHAPGLFDGIAGALRLYQPKFFDILPQYVLLMAAAPWIVQRVATGHSRQVVLLSAGLGLLAQSGLGTMSLATLVGSLRAHGLDLPVGSDFNPLAWQLIFVAGIVLGGHSARGSFGPGWFMTGPGRRLCALALVVDGVLLVLRLMVTLRAPPGAIASFGGAIKTRLGLLPLASFAALAYPVAWLLAAVAMKAGGGIGRLGRSLYRLATLPALTLLGRHSLAVFVTHAALSYGLGLVEGRRGALGEPAFTLAELPALGCRAGVAWLLDRGSALPAAGAIGPTA